MTATTLLKSHLMMLGWWISADSKDCTFICARIVIAQQIIYPLARRVLSWRTKWTKFIFGWGSSPQPHWGSSRLPPWCRLGALSWAPCNTLPFETTLCSI